MIEKTALTNKILKKILGQINRDKQMKQQYESKWHKTVNFLYNSTGLSIDKVAMGGSSGKQTYYYESDLDTIFCTPEDLDRPETIEYLVEKAEQNFANASIGTSSRAVHIDFNSGCKIDLVYKHQNEFSREYREIKNIRQLSGTQQNAIKIVKWVFDHVNNNNIQGYEVEYACVQMNHKGLPAYVEALVRHFRGRLNYLGVSVKNVVDFLVSNGK